MNPRPTAPHLDRDVRQRAIVPPARLAVCQALVVGVGAIGRQVALQLAAVGVPHLSLFEDDYVSVENLASQGYWAEDLNVAKVGATAALCRRMNPQVEVSATAERFKRSTAAQLPAASHRVVFACVDSIAARRLLWEALRDRAALFIDGRMSAEVIRVLAVAAPGTDSRYLATLFDPAEAYAGACTARSTIFTASIAAGLMVEQFTKWLRGLSVDPDLMLNLLSSELVTNDPALEDTKHG